MGRWAVGYIVATLPLVVGAFALPHYHLVFWGLLGWSAAAAVVVGAYRNRPRLRSPWVLVAVALAAFVSGDMAYDVLTDVLHYRDPFPSVADAFYLATYPIFACGLLGLLRARSRERNLGPLLDALIVTASCAVFLMEPYVRATDMTLFEKVVSISYPLGDIAILCVLARLVLSVGLRNWSVRLLTLGALGLLTADVLYGGIQLNENWRAGGPTDAGWVLFYVCWGAAVLHPSMRQVTEAQPLRERRLSMTALVALSGATLVAPGLLVWRAANGGVGGDVGVIAVGSGVVFVLVMARLTSLARAQAAQADRERALRAIGERLVVASELAAVDSAAVAAMESLVGSQMVACLVTVPEGRFDRAIAAQPEALVGFLLELERIGRDGSSLLARRADGEPLPGATRATKWHAFSFGGMNSPERRVVIGHRGSLPLGSADVEDVFAAQLTLAADRVQLGDDLQRRKSEARFRSLIRNVSDVILVVQASGDLRSETPSIEAVLGYGADTTARRLEDLVHPRDAPAAMASIEAMLAGTDPGPIYGEWRIRHADGRWLTMDVVGNDLSEDAHVDGVVLTMRDVSDRKVLEEELRHHALHDTLTKLPNRVLFDERVTHALSRRSRLGTEVRVLLLDIDDFKLVNDTLGHPAGDELLVQFTERLVGCLRSEDTAARFGGDEFAVCIEVEANQPEHAAAAERIIAAMDDSFRVADTDVHAHVSIGISVAGDATEGSSEMLREADLALYAAKNAGKGSLHFFEESLHQAVRARVEQRDALELAINHHQLRLHYQPIVKLRDGTTAGVEALVRWQHPTLGHVPPAEFLPLAEDSGLVVPLGRWVLDRACADLSRWQRRWNAGSNGPLHLTVNISPRQFQSTDFVSMVDDTLRRHHIDPTWLWFDITEGLLAHNSPEVVTRLHALHDRGIDFALDNFGTGYSSMSYLYRFPIRFLEIDRSFVADMGDRTAADKRAAVVRAIVSMAHSLGLELIAEGIETEFQARELRSLGCDYGQGFHLGRPVPAESIDELINRASSSSASGAEPIGEATRQATRLLRRSRTAFGDKA